MAYRPNTTVAIQFTTTSPITGLAANADSLPVGTVSKNGTDDGAVTVTVSNIATGRYKASFTIPASYAIDDIVEITISVVLAGISETAVIFRALLDSKIVSDLNDAPDLTTDLADAETAILTAIGEIPAGGATAAEIWDYLLASMATANSIGEALAALLAVFNAAQRTLTSSAAQTYSMQTGSRFVIYSGSTFTAALSALSIPANWSKAKFTLKHHDDLAIDDDLAAAVQILISNPTQEGDGLVIFNKAPSAQPESGSLALNAGAGTAAIMIANSLDLSTLIGPYDWDIKLILDDGTSYPLTGSTALVTATPTKSN